MKSKTWFYKFIFGLLFTIVIFSLITIFIDPYFHFHKPFSFISYRLYDERYMNDGISRHFDFDAMITGTSISQNFKTSELDALFGTKSVKETFSGSGYKEQSENIMRAIKYNSNLETVFWGLDYNGLLRDSDWKRYDEYPTYLYDNNIFNDVAYLLNKSIMYHGTLLNIYMTLTNQASTSFDEYSYWEDDYKDAYFTRASQIDPMKPSLSNDQRKIVCDTINQNVVAVAKQNPNVTFYIFLPPCSINYFDNIYAQGDTIIHLDAEQQAIELMLQCENIKLFSFTNNHEIINNLDNYHDGIHYNAKINSLLLKYMVNDEYRITKENYQAHIANAKDYYLNFDYDSVY